MAHLKPEPLWHQIKFYFSESKNPDGKRYESTRISIPKKAFNAVFGGKKITPDTCYLSYNFSFEDERGITHKVIVISDVPLR